MCFTVTFLQQFVNTGDIVFMLCHDNMYTISRMLVAVTIVLALIYQHIPTNLHGEVASCITDLW